MSDSEWSGGRAVLDGSGGLFSRQPVKQRMKTKKKKSLPPEALFPVPAGYLTTLKRPALCADGCQYQRHLSALHGRLGLDDTESLNFPTNSHKELNGKVLVHDLASAKSQ